MLPKGQRIALLSTACVHDRGVILITDFADLPVELLSMESCHRVCRTALQGIRGVRRRQLTQVRINRNVDDSVERESA